MFLLISCSLVAAFQYFFVLCTAKANKQSKKRTKIYNKETGKFHSQSHFINLLAGGFVHLFQGAVARTFVHNLGGVWVFYFALQKELYFLCFPGN